MYIKYVLREEIVCIFLANEIIQNYYVHIQKEDMITVL